ncbi:MAG: branched-chain amino acid ABC transporter permease [Burkholderiales bacterium]|nr:branched-chain amino acid ABC transporter permease [Anaerolineae bacterium]
MSNYMRWLAVRELKLIVVIVVVVAALLSVPLWAGGFAMRTIVELMSLLALAQMWNLLAGRAGLVSVGQQAWIGLGGYAMIVLADDLGINMFIAVLLAGFIPLVLSVPTAALLFRLRGGYFAIGTWVVAEVFRLLVSSSTEWLKGGSGRTLNAAREFERAPRENLTYFLAVLIGVGAVLLVYYLARSKTGLGLAAVRDSEQAAASLGVNTTRIKLTVFAISAFVTGVAGALIYVNILRITPNAAFSVQWTATMIFIVVIGGIGTIEGPIIGTILYSFIREYLANFGEWSFILLGIIAIVMMLVAPQGIWGLLHERFGWELFPAHRLLPARAVDVEDGEAR